VHDNLRNLGLEILNVVNLRSMFDVHGLPVKETVALGFVGGRGAGNNAQSKRQIILIR
jgi:hypothetical protein